MQLTLPVLERDVAYIGASLFLPLSRVTEAPIATALTFAEDTGEPRVLLRHHPYHLEVPRNFLNAEKLRRLGIDRVVDLRPRAYPSSSLRPRLSFALRPHQIPAWEAMQPLIRNRADAVLKLDTGRGKTVMGLLFASEVGGPLLVISAQEAHLRSWEKELHKHFLLDGPVGWISKKKLEYDREIVFATVQTLVKRFEAGDLPLDFHMRFATTIYDEVHHQAAEWFSRGSDLTVGQRLGLTATLTRRDRCEGIVLYQIGPVVYDDPAEDTLVPKVHVHLTGTEIEEDDPEICDVNGMPNVSKLRVRLGREESRNRKIIDVVVMRLREGRKVYLVSHIREHVYELARLLKERGVDAGVITGDEKDAEERLRQLSLHDVVIVTLFVGKENYNRPELSSVILTTPLSVDPHAPTEFVQVVGRGLRPHPGKPEPVVDLFADRETSMSFGLLMTVLNWCRSTGWTIGGDSWTREKKMARVWRTTSRT